MESECIVDFCGRCSLLGYNISYWADYFPKENVVTFGGDWYDVPSMPSSKVPNETTVYKWANKRSNLAKKIEAEIRKKKKFNERMAALDKIYATYGSNKLKITLSKDNVHITIECECGIRTKFQILEAVSYNIKTPNNKYYGFKITKFEFIQNIPQKVIDNYLKEHILHI